MGPRLIILGIVGLLLVAGCAQEQPAPAEGTKSSSNESGGEKVESGGQLGVNPNYQGK